MARQKLKLKDAALNELRAAFEGRTLGHAIIDVQPYYCDPQMLRERAYRIGDIQEIFDTARRVEHFARRMMPALKQFWVAHVTPRTMTRSGPVASEDRKITDAERNRLAINELRNSVFSRGGQGAVGKPGFDAFNNTDFKQQIERAGVNTLLLSGFYADKCVLETAQSAVKYGLKTYVVEDLTRPFVPSDTLYRDVLDHAGVVRVSSATVRQAQMDTWRGPGIRG